MIIRKADLRDLNGCVALDTTYATEHVWQVRTEERPYEEVLITLHTIKLPRSVRARPPRGGDHLVEDWQQGGCFLVADDEGELRGYLNMTVEPGLARGWVKDLAVVTPYRRQGIGSELVRAALRWGRERALRSVLAETQTKNYPAICFCRKHGFVFCGFIDQYYPNQDIAVFFARGL
jgi:ribosomal protein S18 acetylase RimI-like enzyme